jgi:transcription antitermination factor NusA-like protein
VFLVHARDISAAVGQHRANIETLKKEFGLRNVRFVERSSSDKRGEAVLLAG